MENQALGQHIALTEIKASYTNPRKRFNEVDLQELADSIKAHGVMQPILVRPWAHPENSSLNMSPSDYGIKYQIVAGERRWRASQLAQQETIPAIVRELDDLETLQLQIIENLQRSDLHPLEEAQGFKALLDNKDAKSWNADELAVKIGKSRSYIYGALKLNELCTFAQDIFLDGRFGREIALLIARIPGEKLQKQATKEIVNGNGQDTFSFRAAKNYIRDRYTLSLTSAVFDTNTTSLLPAAGSCLSCPKRSGNYPELFPDMESTDVCTDPDCFGLKKAMHVQLLIAKAPKAITGEEAAKIMPYGANSWVSGSHYEKPTDIAMGTGKPWQELLGEYMPEPVLIVDEKNNTTNLYEVSALQEKLQEKIASGELVLEAKAPAEKNVYQIEQEALHIKQAEETTRRLAIFNKLAKHLHNQDYENMSLRLAVDMLSREVSADLTPILNHYDFEGEEDEFFIEFLSIAQPRSCLIKMLVLLSLVAGTEVSRWQWKSEENNADDKDYQSLLNFIGDIGLDVSQFLTAELPFTPPLAAQAVELSAETAEAVTENQLPPKLQAIKDKELAKRAKKAQKQEHNESANADLTTQALTQSAQTSEVIQEVEVEV
ncbi:MAG: ParB/RepB/Spo0J family partition protein [Methylotenera sp.]|nr:ParB/RepB/Spo0J family partition protein [Methylotenera sp.]